MEPADFTIGQREASAAASMDLRRHMASLARTPARSAALITAELREVFLLVATLASAAASMEAEAFTEAEEATAEAVTDNPVVIPEK